MARRVYEIRELGEFLRSLHKGVRRATGKALVRTVVAGERQAKRNARENFKGTRDRPKSGFLLNAIFSGFELAGAGTARRIAEGFVGVKGRKGNKGTRPYGRIQELGGVIKPKKAKWLWIPLFGPKTNLPAGLDVNDMTPKDFMSAKRNEKSSIHWWILNGKKGGMVAGATIGVSKKSSGRRKVATLGNTVKRVTLDKTTTRLKVIPLFALKKMVDMPAKPYVGPAVEKEFPRFREHLAAELEGLKK